MLLPGDVAPNFSVFQSDAPRLSAPSLLKSDGVRRRQIRRKPVVEERLCAAELLLAGLFDEAPLQGKEARALNLIQF